MAEVVWLRVQLETRQKTTREVQGHAFPVVLHPRREVLEPDAVSLCGLGDRTTAGEEWEPLGEGRRCGICRHRVKRLPPSRTQEWVDAERKKVADLIGRRGGGDG